jgi:hypothetical protein
MQTTIQKPYEVRVFSGKFCPEITEFVANVFYTKTKLQFRDTFNSFLKAMLTEDKLYADASSTVCIYNSSGDICCTARLIKRDHLPLPFEKEFNIDLGFFSVDYTEVYQVARFASSEEKSFKSLYLLMQTMFSQIHNKGSLLVGGLEKSVYKVLSMAGCPFYPLGYEVICFGTSSVPVGIRLSEIKTKFTAKCY